METVFIKTDIEIDIDDVFSKLTPSQKNDFINENIDYADADNLIDAIKRNNNVPLGRILDEYGNNEIIDYLTSQGFRVI